VNEIERQFRESIAVKEKLLAQGGAETLGRMAEALTAAFKAGRAFYLFGNGGSAADCQHIAGEFVGRFMKERRALPCVAFTTDTSVLTAIGNDYGYDTIFERQVEALVRRGDVVLGVSTSGNSKNVNRAILKAKAQGALALAFSGRDGGELARLADICLVAPAQTSARIQETHIMAAHILCDLVERGVFPDA